MWSRKFKSLGFKTFSGKKKHKLRDLIEYNVRFPFHQIHPILILLKRAFLELHDQCVVSVAFELFNEYMYIVLKTISSQVY